MQLCFDYVVGILLKGFISVTTTRHMEVIERGRYILENAWKESPQKIQQKTIINHEC